MASFGWCSQCNVEHRLEEGRAHDHALQLMQKLKDFKRIDFRNSTVDADPRFSTDYLFGEALGKMFGVLECEDVRGERVVLRAFSGQYNAVWNVEGWAPPLFETETHDQIMIPADRIIKELGRKIADGNADDEELEILKNTRKRVSQAIMKELHNLYQLKNFHGETMPLTEFFKTVKGTPTGAGDCCAPKLLNQAVFNNLRPLGISEFYWGRSNRSGTREQGEFYSSCLDKCLPILGFMLCGAGK